VFPTSCTDANDAKIYAFCGANQSCDDTLSEVLGYRKSGSASPRDYQDGLTLSSGQRLVFKIMPGDGLCKDDEITIGPGEYITVGVDGQPLTVALPEGDYASLTLYVSEDGSTFTQGETMFAKPVASPP